MADPEIVAEPPQIDREIAALRRQGKRASSVDSTTSLTSSAKALRKALQVQCSTILSAASTTRLIQSEPDGKRQRDAPLSREKLADRAKQQQVYMQQCVYRVSAPVTAFKVRDPDPNAVDAGHVLGLRFEIMSRGQFLRPYYVMLNRPFIASGSRRLRVHRHTVPPAVPLAGLAARHLPGKENQDLDRFVRALRREIVRYHNRLGVSADLRRRLGLQARGASSANAIVEVGIADIEAKQISLTWADDRTGRLVMDDDGNVVNFVVVGAEGREWDASRVSFGRHGTIDEVARRLEEYARQ